MAPIERTPCRRSGLDASVCVPISQLDLFDMWLEANCQFDSIHTNEGFSGTEQEASVPPIPIMEYMTPKKNTSQQEDNRDKTGRMGKIAERIESLGLEIDELRRQVEQIEAKVSAQKAPIP